MNFVSIILVILVAFLAGMEGILDEFQFHQPLVACTLIGLATGNLTACVILGGTLQMIAIGWANIGAAVSPDAALASIASAIILVKGGQGESGVGSAIGLAIPLAVAGLFLTMLVRTLAVPLVHAMDKAASQGHMKMVEWLHIAGIGMQGLRIALPSVALLAIPTDKVREALEKLPEWLNQGMTIGGGMVVAVGYALVINMMANREVWPFFILGFVIAAISELTLIALGAIGISLALIYLTLSKMGNSGGGGGNTGDPLGDILNDY